MDFSPQIEVGIHQLVQPGIVPRQQAGASLGGVTGPRPHRAHHIRVAAQPALPQGVVKHFRAFAERRPVGDVHIRQQARIHTLVLAVAARLHQGPGEIHIHQALIGLHHAILQSRGNAQLPGFRLQRQVGLHRKRNLQPVILAERAQRRRDDGARSAEPQALRHIGVVLQREVAIRQLGALLAAVIHQADNQCLDDPNTAVIAAPPGNPV